MFFLIVLSVPLGYIWYFFFKIIKRIVSNINENIQQKAHLKELTKSKLNEQKTQKTKNSLMDIINNQDYTIKNKTAPDKQKITEKENKKIEDIKKESKSGEAENKENINKSEKEKNNSEENIVNDEKDKKEETKKEEKIVNKIDKKTKNLTPNDISKLSSIKYECISYKERWKLELYEKKIIEWLSIDPNNIDFLRMLSDLYLWTGKQKKSLTLLKKILDIKVDDHATMWKIWQIYLDDNDFKTAKILIDKAIKIKNTDPKYYISMTDIMYNMDNIEQAIENIQKAIQLRPKNTNYLIALATLYEEKLDIENAKKYYFKVIEMDPINDIAKKRLKNL